MHLHRHIFSNHADNQSQELEGTTSRDTRRGIAEACISNLTILKVLLARTQWCYSCCNNVSGSQRLMSTCHWENVGRFKNQEEATVAKENTISLNQARVRHSFAIIYFPAIIMTIYCVPDRA